MKEGGVERNVVGKETEPMNKDTKRGSADVRR